MLQRPMAALSRGVCSLQLNDYVCYHDTFYLFCFEIDRFCLNRAADFSAKGCSLVVGDSHSFPSCFPYIYAVLPLK